MILGKCANALLLAMALCGFAALCAADESNGEYRVKAVLLSKIIGFVSWPEGNAGDATRSLCIAGRDPFGDALDAAFAGHPDIELRRLGTDSTKLPDCDLVFISDSERRDYQQILVSLRQRPILTISDIPRFANHGGMINLALINRRVRFLINQQELERSGMRISYKLLKLADIVRPTDPQTEKAQSG